MKNSSPAQLPPSWGHLVWLAFALIAAFTIYFMISNTGWMLSAVNQPKLSVIGLYLSASGILGTIAGFIVTFQQLLKVQGAAKAVDLALDQARESLAALNSTGDVERARLALEAAVASIKSGEGGDAQSHLSIARQCLFRILHRAIEPLSDFQNEISDAISDIAKICDSMDDMDSNAVRKLSGWSRQYVDLVDKIQVNMTRVK